MNLTIKEFLSRYAAADGYIHAENTGLSLKKLDQNSSFVLDLVSLEENDFFSATETMVSEAIRLYLYNKYPVFFSAWDRGRKITSRMVDGLLDGSLDALEINTSGGMDNLITQLKRSIDRKDQILLTKIQWLKKPDQNRMFVDLLVKSFTQDSNAPKILSTDNLPNTVEEFLKRMRSAESKLSGGSPSAWFVRVLNLFSDSDFDLCCHEMTQGEKKLYFYNKYPAFFQRWDNGFHLRRKGRSFIDPARVMDGWIEEEELWQAVNQNINEALETFYRQIKAEMSARDLRLFIGCQLIVNQTLHNRMLAWWMHSEHDATIRALFSQVVSVPYIRQEEKHRENDLCVHEFDLTRSGKQLNFQCTFSLQSMATIQPDVEWSRLECRIGVIQKFWLRMTLQKQEVVSEEELNVGIDGFDDRYVIHSNNPEAAKSFFAGVASDFQKIQQFITRFEIYRGVISCLLINPNRINDVGSNLNHIADAFVRIAEVYEYGQSIRLIAKSSSSCPFCRELLKESFVTCAACGTKVHSACWLENRQCTTWGCSSTKTK